MDEPNVNDKIPPLCQQTFVTLERGLITLWILGGLLLSGVGSVVAWGYATGKTITALEISDKNTSLQLSKFDADINRKLDILIGRR